MADRKLSPCPDCGRLTGHAEKCIEDFAATFEIPVEQARDLLNCVTCDAPEYCIGVGCYDKTTPRSTPESQTP